MRVVVVGATGNAGTSVVQALGADPQIESILGLARRLPQWSPEKTRWACADIADDTTELAGHFAGADAVIHLAWLFQPTHHPATTWRTNVQGSIRVFEAAAAAGVPALIYASFVGAYSPGPKDRAVDELWPTDGWPESTLCQEKAYIERVLDTFELQRPEIRVVRMRPGFMFKREAACEQHRLFRGPLVPKRLTRPEHMPAIPAVPGMRYQVLHTDDAAEAFRQATVRTVRGAFNLAAEPVVDAAMLGEMFGARTFLVPGWPVRAAVSAAWRTHLLRTPPSLFDAMLHFPIMDTSRARQELDWAPRYSVQEAMREWLAGLREDAGMPTPPLASPAGRASEAIRPHS
ncbi:NAD-dependent epimerase/dehydratase family protein [Streptomyces camelliae]|uniref:NAD-dependent epimerase/dehydratase family protein n=1 Tax=Streptomyces camelliae TaxID=3004093 RepID=A0ABY7NVC8_9ACTN|nr:NAD-dependent epimerase/dehydratase family protein [Streptomyces sp. HUAS 2-6]WBO62198.1 NAD-dependent epimerase/dehydratase family protein [Streptomyces sp. HUAS 2-6]